MMGSDAVRTSLWCAPAAAAAANRTKGEIVLAGVIFFQIDPEARILTVFKRR